MLFAQHYFVDVPAGIAVAILSIIIASYAAKAKKVFELSCSSVSAQRLNKHIGGSQWAAGPISATDD